MIIDSIKIENFRCFYGEHEIELAYGSDKNVTLIYAENGVGKTTLLNSILWCFYGKVTEGFEEPNDIINHTAAKEGKKSANIKIYFEHDGKNYLATRTWTQDTAAHNGVLRIAEILDGHQRPIDTPDTFIETLIPYDMAGHFLFEGEHATQLMSAFQNHSSLKEAVRDILGCGLIENAIEDLKVVSKNFRREMTQNADDDEIVNVEKEISALERQIDQAELELKEAEKSRLILNDQIEDINKSLRNSAPVKEFQKTRDTLEKQLKLAEKRKEEALTEVVKWVGNHGRFIVSTGVTEETFEFLDEQEHKGKIPSPYNEEFVNDLLDSKECVCGTSLPEGSQEREKIKSLLDKAANKTLRDRVSRVKATLSNLKQGRVQAPSKLSKEQKNLFEEDEDIERLEKEIGELSQKIKKSNVKDIQEKEDTLQKKKKEYESLVKEIGALELNKGTAEKQLASLKKSINDLSLQSAASKALKRRHNLCEKLKGYLENKLDADEKEARSILRASLRKIIDKTTRKNYSFKMSDDYSCKLVNESGKPMAKSGGENQLLGLAFTAALVQFAKMRRNAEDFTLLPGTIAPLILDSPFGSLDDHYREATATFLPEMAQQVVLLLSSSQYSEDIRIPLKDHISHEYVLIRHNLGKQGEKREEIKHINGKDYSITEFDSDFDGTEIRKVA